MIFERTRRNRKAYNTPPKALYFFLVVFFLVVFFLGAAFFFVAGFFLVAAFFLGAVFFFGACYVKMIYIKDKYMN